MLEDIILKATIAHKTIKNFMKNNFNEIRARFNDVYSILKKINPPVLRPRKNLRLINFKNSFINNDIEDLYRKLIKDLDLESIKTVNSIIATFQKIIADPNAEYLDIFSNERKLEIDKIKKEFRNNVIQLNENCYSLNGYFLPINRFEESVFYSNYQIDKLNNQDKFKNKNILDVGGFVGDSALLFSKYTNKNVHVFEPIKEQYDLIFKTIELNNSQNIIPHNLGLGNKSEKTIINIESGSSSITLPKYNPNCSTEQIKIKTLDDFVRENPMEIGLIKVDIEGFEQQFLQGAKETICTQKPSLLISIYHSFEDFFEIKPMIESWNLGYKFKIARPDDDYFYLETLLIAETDEAQQ